MGRLGSLSQGADSLRQRIAAAPTTKELVSNKAEVRLIRDQRSEATVRGFTVTQDEPASAGGTGAGPTPTDYFIASVGFCENVIFACDASLAHLSVDLLDTVVSGSWDRRGLFEINGASPYFETITVETRAVNGQTVPL